MNIHLFFRVPNRLLSIPPPLSTLKRVLLRNFSSSENRRFPLKHFTVFENHFKSLILQHALRAKRATIIFSCLLSLYYYNFSTKNQRFASRETFLGYFHTQCICKRYKLAKKKLFFVKIKVILKQRTIRELKPSLENKSILSPTHAK